METAIALPKSYQTLKIINPHLTTVQRRLVREGLAGYEPETMATVLALLETTQDPDPVFFDVGAHVGVYSWTVVGSPVRANSVVGFEPTPETHAVGEATRRANGLNFRYEQIALSDNEGEASFFLSVNGESSNSLEVGFRTASEVIRVPTKTLDSYASMTSLIPSVIKIDVESHEHSVLSGGLSTIARRRPDIVVEILRSRQKVFFEGLVWSRLRELGYVAFHISPAVPWRSSKRDDRFPKSRDWLLTHRSLSRRFWRAYIDWRYHLSRCTPKRVATISSTLERANDASPT